MRVLVFGGSFNPPHLGHLAMARHCRDALGFDRILLVPCGDLSRKRDLAPARARLALVEALVACEHGLQVCAAEIDRPLPVAAVRTVREVRAERPDVDLWILRGQDALPRTHHALFAVPGLRILVLARAGAPPLEEALRRNPHLGRHRDRIHVDHGFQHPASATAVREAIRSRKALDDLVPPEVARRITELGLYLPGDGTASRG